MAGTEDRKSGARTSVATLVADPRLVPFLPLLYVAWADGELTLAERREICARVDGDPGSDAQGSDSQPQDSQRRDTQRLDAACRAVLAEWLDPSAPPTAGELQAVLNAIRRVGERLTRDRRRTLAELGLELAQETGATCDAATRKALDRIEQALGVAGPEASRAVLAAGRRSQVEPPGGRAARSDLAASFDLPAMTRLLAGDHAELKGLVRGLLCRDDFRYEYGLDREAYRSRVLDWCRILADEGLGLLGLPREQGGGGDVGATIAVFETLAYGDLSLLVKFGVQFGLFAGSIQQLGTRRHHEVYLEPAAKLEIPGCFAMTETGHGSNVQELETTCCYDPSTQRFVLHTPHPGARKDYIGNAAAHGRMATVFARLVIGDEDFGVHAFLVPIRTRSGASVEGVSIEDCGEKMGLNGVDNGRLSFSHVSLPREALLNRFADVDADGSYRSPIPSPSRRFFTMLGTLVGGRVSIAHAAASASHSALAIAVRYAEKRAQFGPAGEAETTILDYLSHQRRLFPRLATSYALHFALGELRAQFLDADESSRRRVEALAAGLKAFASRHATDTIQSCREACGAQGYLAANRFAALKADTDVFTTFEGDNTVLLQLVAKGLLLDFRDQFEDMGVISIARYVAAAAATTIAELNPVVTRLTDEDHLRGADFQLAAFRWREGHLLTTVAQRLKKRVDRGVDSHRALIECQDHLLELARAHVDRVVLEQFVAGVETAAPVEAGSSNNAHSVAGPSDSRQSQGERADPGEVLSRLRQLFALTTLERHRGWYLEQGYIAGSKAKAIRKLINRICGEVRPDAVALVDAFDIPDELLAAPIAIDA